MRRAVGLAVCALTAWCGLASAGPAAASARPSAASLAHSAHILAALVRRSAHGAGRDRSSGVVTIRCCGHRVLDVYYRARPHARVPWHGTYELELTRRGAFLESVQVSFFPTAAKWAFGGASAHEGPRYAFTIASPRRGRGWHLTVADSFLGCGPSSGAARQCEGFSDELSLGQAQLRTRQFKALFSEALRVVRKANRHVPISSADVVAAVRASHAAQRRLAPRRAASTLAASASSDPPTNSIAIPRGSPQLPMSSVD
jgi:hypothetical protein